MLEIGPRHSLSYRQEILLKLFDYIESADSFFVIGAASMGKTRLMDHTMRPEVQKHYLGDKAPSTWLIRIDLNRMPARENWNFYELLLSSLILTCNDHRDLDEIDTIQTIIAELDRDVIESRDYLLALRLFELAINRLCQQYNLRLCFLFDEFDEMYATLPRELFAQLRAVRDSNKNRLCYGIYMRHLPERIRVYSQVESFRELFSNRLVGLTPYNLQDSIQMLLQLEARKSHPLPAERREWIYLQSGGHPGTISALMDLFINNPQAAQKTSQTAWFGDQSGIADECEKIWAGLGEDERAGLLALGQGAFTGVSPLPKASLRLKGLVTQQNGADRFFSPLFEHYIRSQLP